MLVMMEMYILNCTNVNILVCTDHRLALVELGKGHTGSLCIISYSNMCT